MSHRHVGRLHWQLVAVLRRCCWWTSHHWVWRTSQAYGLIKDWERAGRFMLTTNWSQLRQLDGNNGSRAWMGCTIKTNHSAREGSDVWLLHAPNATSNAPHTKHLSDSWTWADERRIQSLFWVMDSGNRKAWWFQRESLSAWSGATRIASTGDAEH